MLKYVFIDLLQSFYIYTYVKYLLSIFTIDSYKYITELMFNLPFQVLSVEFLFRFQ